MDKTELYAYVGERITLFRLAKGLTQEELAERVGIHRLSINNIELGNQQISTYILFRIAEELDRPILDFIPK